MVKSVRSRAPARTSLMSSRAALAGQVSGSWRSSAGPSTSMRCERATESAVSLASAELPGGRSREVDFTVTLTGPPSSRRSRAAKPAWARAP